MAETNGLSPLRVISDQPVGRISDSVIRRSLRSCGCAVAGYAFG